MAFSLADQCGVDRSNDARVRRCVKRRVGAAMPLPAGRVA